MLYEGGGERTREGGSQNMCQTLNNERERGTTLRLKRRKGIVALGLFRMNFSCTLLPNSKEERYSASSASFSIQFHATPEDGLISRNIYIVFLVFHFCDTHLEVSLISMNLYHLELMPESY